MNRTDRKNCLSVPYADCGQEGFMPVPGGVLHYRVAGSEAANDVVVVENGWGTVFPYTAWLEKALAPHVRIVCYDRAGIGNSTSTEPITTAKMTEQLIALLAGLGISQPVVVLGHSYGGLIAALHASQAPARVRAVIQVDPTPEYAYKEDRSTESAPITTVFTKLALRLGFTRFFTSIFDGLPEDARLRVTKSRSWMIHILNGSIPEIRLFRGIQSAIQSSDVGRQCPRLVISAIPPVREGLLKLAISQQKFDSIMSAAQQIHQRQAKHNAASQWTQIPYNHYTMITSRDGAECVAKHALGFMRSLAAR